MCPCFSSNLSGTQTTDYHKKGMREMEIEDDPVTHFKNTVLSFSIKKYNNTFSTTK